MKKALRILAAIIVLAGAGFWLAAGAHRGFTVNNQPRTIVDPVTGLEGITYEKVFVPGWDFLSAVLIASGVLIGASFIFNRKKLEPEQQSDRH